MTTAAGAPPIEPSFDEQLGEAIHQVLWRRRIKQTQFGAEVLGITQSALSNKLRGKRPFTAQELSSIADALQLDLNKLTPRGFTGPFGPDGGGLSRLGESNPRPIH
ncbi:helix-turn-helix transcriptional regulator [Mycolicibacterium austroafricanum]|uniref:Helix-turn-helix transcriptional regulator n=1 Tax=Mycolicibacterium austroafricanum TaxID=39687 RepID=A0ABT8HKX4_MYCAO|nr:helix-turn-helix transcriptional regulator [Mycolicibacterium austroafricanum]MDN4521409.1 helix-turn-helix transcriptional regulator [Mycolicibacterium austroafricanum]